VLGRGQELLRQAIEEEVDAIDFARFWKGVEEKLPVQPLPWTARMRLWSEQWRPRWAFSPPLWAVVAACLLLGISLWSGQLPFQLTRTDPPPRSTTTKNVTHEDSEPFALAANDQAQIESLSTTDTVMVWNEPASNATVIWVGDENDGGMP
jgi:hypothetical protein